MTIDAYHIILAGGSGTRFWPLSRTGRPKQFLSLAGGSPLLRQAFDRAAAMSGAGRVWVSAGAGQRGLVRSVLPELPDERFIGEPVARNTGPCAGLSALLISRIDPAAVLVMAPADHVYAREDLLAASIGTAVEAARATGALVTLGIRPLRPETGYGYIEAAGPDAGLAGAGSGVLRVARFVEKPDAATASRYLSAGNFYWNSGLFVWSVRAILDAIRACAPDVWAPLEALSSGAGFPHDASALEAAFAAMPSISIDYAVLERAPRILVVPTDPGWSDVGSWDAVASLHEADQGGEAAEGSAGVLSSGSSGCFVYGQGSGRLVALVGVEDLILVDAGDALLVCRKGESQRVRDIVEALRSRGRTDLL